MPVTGSGPCVALVGETLVDVVVPPAAVFASTVVEVLSFGATVGMVPGSVVVVESGEMDVEVVLSGVVDPGVVDPGVVEPGVVEPGVVDAGVVDPGVVVEGVLTRHWLAKIAMPSCVQFLPAYFRPGP